MLPRHHSFTTLPVLFPDDLCTLRSGHTGLLVTPVALTLQSSFLLVFLLLLHFLSVSSYSPLSYKFLTLPRNLRVLPLSICVPVCGIQHSLSVVAPPYSVVSSRGRDQFHPLCTLSSWHASWHEQTLLSFTDGEDSKNLLLLYYSLSSPFIPIRCLSASLQRKELAKYPLASLGPSPTVNSEYPSLNIPPDL